MAAKLSFFYVPLSRMGGGYMRYKFGFTLFCCLFFISFSLPAKTLTILFINPSHVGQPHWDKAQMLVEKAAQQLDIKLILARTHQSKRSNLYPLLEVIKNNKEPLDGVIFLASQWDDNQYVFSFLEEKKIPFITLENTIDERDRKFLGKAGEKFKYWLAEKSFDDKKAGYLLAQELIKQATHNLSSPISIVAISGARIEISDLRNAGLRQAVAENPQTNLKQLVFNNWDRKKSQLQTQKLLLRYPETRIIWTASDNGGLGAYESVLASGKKPGQDILIGGIDWHSEIFPLIKNGHYNASMGGQVLAATAGLVLLYDFHNGVNKQTLKNMPNLKIDMLTINDFAMLDAMQTPNWDNVDFKKMSIKHNAEAAFIGIGLNDLLSPSTQFTINEAK